MHAPCLPDFRPSAARLSDLRAGCPKVTTLLFEQSFGSAFEEARTECDLERGQPTAHPCVIAFNAWAAPWIEPSRALK